MAVFLQSASVPKTMNGWGSHLRWHATGAFRSPGLEELTEAGVGAAAPAPALLFSVTFFSKPHLSQGKEITWVLKKTRVCVSLGSFNVCGDVLKYERGKYFCTKCMECSCYFSITVWAQISFLAIAMCLRRLYFYT